MPVRRETKKDRGGPEPCPHCGGKKYNVKRVWWLLGAKVQTNVLCYTCNGSGTTKPNRL